MGQHRREANPVAVEPKPVLDATNKAETTSPRFHHPCLPRLADPDLRACHELTVCSGWVWADPAPWPKLFTSDADVA